MKFSSVLLVASFSLAACVDANPIVTDFNGDSVNIQTSQLSTEGTAAANSQKEADRICGKVGKRAEYASTRVLPDYIQESLYLCL